MLSKIDPIFCYQKTDPIFCYQKIDPIFLKLYKNPLDILLLKNRVGFLVENRPIKSMHNFETNGAPYVFASEHSPTDYMTILLLNYEITPVKLTFVI